MFESSPVGFAQQAARKKCAFNARETTTRVRFQPRAASQVHTITVIEKASTADYEQHIM